MPQTAEKIVKMLGCGIRDLSDLDKFGLYESGSKVCETPEILFARLDAKDIMPKVEEIQAAQKAEYERENGITDKENKAEEKTEEVHVEAKDEIAYDDFAKCQFAIGEILKCEEVPKSKKLLCSQVKIGDQTRQILSGIKAYYKPEEMVGKKVMVLLNLAPRSIAGLMSEGMLLCAEGPDGTLALMTPEKDVASGSEIC